MHHMMRGGDGSDDRPEIAFVSQEEQIQLEALARKVASDLAKVGLVVNWEGNSAHGKVPQAPGVRVFYDPVVNSPVGVYVKWMMPQDFMRAAVMAGPQGPMLPVAAAWLEVMLETIAKLLVAAGWEVDAENVGVHESSIRVMRSTFNPFSEYDG